MKPEDLKQRFKEAKRQKQEIESELDECLLVTAPHLAFKHLTSTIDRSLLQDTTAQNGVRTLTTNVLTFLIPVDSPWMKIEQGEEFDELVRTAQPDEIANFGLVGDFDELFEQMNRRLFREINRSNFHRAATPAIQYSIICGTGAMGVELDRTNRLNYYPINIADLYILDNGTYVDTAFKTTRLPARVIAERYKKLPRWLTDMARDKPEQRVEVIESNAEIERGRWHFGRWLAQDWTPLFEREYTFPTIIVFRWEQVPGEAWGTGPVRNMLPDLRTISKLTDYVLDHTARNANPAVWSSDVSLRDQEIGPNQVIHTQDKPEVLDLNGSIATSEAVLRMFQDRVLSGLFADMLPPANAPGERMTTTEVNVRQAEFFRKIRTPAFQLEEEFLKRAVHASIGALQSVQRLPDVKVDGRRIEVSVTSLVRRGEELAEANSNLEALFALSQHPVLGQIALDNLNLIELVRDSLTALGVSHRYLRDEDTVIDNAQIGQVLQQLLGNVGQQGGPRGDQPADPAGPLLPGVFDT